jgi:penicillin-binding protein 1A
MGNGETGGAAALPIWIGYMEHALKGVPESWQETPDGMVPIVAHDPSGKTSKELIYREHLPPPPAEDEEVKPVPAPTPAAAQVQAPAPVQDAKPKLVEKPVADKQVPQKPAEKKP